MRLKYTVTWEDEVLAPDCGSEEEEIEKAEMWFEEKMIDLFEHLSINDYESLEINVETIV
jgi:hypothetical protein